MRCVLQILGGQLRRSAEADDAGNIFRSRPPSTLLAAAGDERL